MPCHRILAVVCQNYYYEIEDAMRVDNRQLPIWGCCGERTELYYTFFCREKSTLSPTDRSVPGSRCLHESFGQYIKVLGL